MARRRNGGITIPVAVALGFAPLAVRGFSLVKQGGFANLSKLSSSIIPYDNAARRVSFADLSYGLYPIIAGLMVHKFIGGGLGLNRMLAGAKIPWLRI